MQDHLGQHLAIKDFKSATQYRLFRLFKEPFNIYDFIGKIFNCLTQADYTLQFKVQEAALYTEGMTITSSLLYRCSKKAEANLSMLLSFLSHVDAFAKSQPHPHKLWLSLSQQHIELLQYVTKAYPNLLQTNAVHHSIHADTPRHKLA